MSKLYVFKHYPPTTHFPVPLALNSHTYSPLFEKILDPPLLCIKASLWCKVSITT